MAPCPIGKNDCCFGFSRIGAAELGLAGMLLYETFLSFFFGLGMSDAFVTV